MAFTATAAIIAGSQAVTATLVLAAVAEIGMAVTLVGAVTGNKKMMKIGGVMSLVGGVGGMVAGAFSGGAGAAGAAASGAAEGAFEAGFVGSAASAGAAEAGMLAAQGASGALSGMDAVLQGAVDFGANNAVQAGSELLGSNINAVTASGEAIKGAADFADLTRSTQEITAASTNAAAQVATPSQGAGVSKSMQVGKNLGEVAKVKRDGFWGAMDNMGNWMEKNKTLAGTIVKLGGHALEGMANSKGDKMTEYQRREVELAERIQNNRESAPAPRAAPVVQTHPQSAPATSGLIRRAM